MKAATTPTDGELHDQVMEEEGLVNIPDEAAFVTELSHDLAEKGVESTDVMQAVREVVTNADDDVMSTCQIFADVLQMQLAGLSPAYTLERVRRSVDNVFPGYSLARFVEEEGEFHEVDAEEALDREDDKPSELPF